MSTPFSSRGRRASSLSSSAAAMAFRSPRANPRLRAAACAAIEPLEHRQMLTGSPIDPSIDVPTAVLRQGDKLIVAAQQVAGDDVALARFDADGTLDASFGNGGRLLLDLGGLDVVHALAIDAGGNILAAGAVGDSGGASDMVVARLNGVTGALDASFGGGDGIATIHFDAGPAEAFSIAVGGTGRIAVGGNVAPSVVRAFGVAELEADGTPVAGFGDANGTAMTVFTDGVSPVDAALNAIAFNGVDDIVAGGQSQSAGFASSFTLVEYDAASGALDTDFGGDGIVVTDFDDGFGPRNSVINAIAINGNKLVAIGSDIAQFDLANNAILDPAFNGGATFNNAGAPLNSVFAGNVSGNGVILAGFAFDNDGNQHLATARYNYTLPNQAGTLSLDGAYGVGGLFDTGVDASNGATVASVSADGSAALAAPVFNPTESLNAGVAAVNALGQAGTGTYTGEVDFTLPFGAANVAPVAMISGPATSVPGATVTFTGSFDDAGDVAPHTYLWTVTGPDSFSATGTASTIDIAPTAAGDYTITLTVTDSGGLSGTTNVTLTVVNVAPTAHIAGPATGNPGAAVTYTGTFDDLGDTSAHTFAWTVAGPGGFSATGTNPTITFTPLAGGNYNVSLIVTDGDGLSDSESATLTVVNAAPIPAIAGPTTGTAGSPLTFNGSFTDANDSTTHTLAWSVSGPGGFTANGTGNAITFTPPAAGNFVVNLTVTDGGGLAGTATATVVVAAPPPVSVVAGVLTVQGTAGNNAVRVERVNGQYRVTFDNQTVSFPVGSVTSIRINGGDGADVIDVDNNVTVNAELHGGAGADLMSGGGGNDMLFGEDGADLLTGATGDDVFVGGAGNDLLFGGSGQDVLIGGQGADYIEGDAGSDILIAGYTSHDANPVALAAIRTVWTGVGSYDFRVNALRTTLLVPSGLLRTVFDDGAVDLLYGGGGRDWFILNLNGSNIDQILLAANNEVRTDI